MAGRRNLTRRKSVLIVCPAKPGSRFGNRIRALRYQSIFEKLGYRARIDTQISGQPDVAVILHAFRSAPAVATSKSQMPNRPVVLAVTGTDLYKHGQAASCRQSFALADRIVVAQPTMVNDVPTAYRKKCVSIYQSATALSIKRPKNPRQLRVVVSGHLRDVKDPFRAAMAVRQLPENSRIVVDHYGASLQDSMQRRARAEMKRNARYHWHGEVTQGEVRRKLARAWLMVLSSKMEGGANVLSEAVAARTPVLASRIPGSTGLLGSKYPGLFDVGDTAALLYLLKKCEADTTFYESLQSHIATRTHLVEPSRESKAWKKLLRSLEA